MRLWVLGLVGLLLSGCPKARPFEQVYLSLDCPTGESEVLLGHVLPALCPPVEGTDRAVARVARQYNLTGDPRWGQLAIVFVPEAIQCAGRETFGCTDLENGIIAVSTWPGPYHSALEHELSHYAIYLNGGGDLDHMRLDGLLDLGE